jgi:hypothetical protein
LDGPFVAIRVFKENKMPQRRILSELDKFKTIVLDFDRVTTVGQAFADEIFRVFQQRHPNITIIPINMVEPVKFMIDRVEKPSFEAE